MKTDAAFDVIEREIKRNTEFGSKSRVVITRSPVSGQWRAQLWSKHEKSGRSVISATGVTPNAALSNLANAL